MENLVIIPEKELKALLKNQNRMLNLLEDLANRKPNKSGDFKYISEDEAKQMLGKKATWFWQQRTKGRIKFSKVGNSIFYERVEIEKLFEDNSFDTF